MSDSSESSWIIRGYSHRLPVDFAWDSQHPPLGWTGWIVHLCAAGQWEVRIDNNPLIKAKAGSVICSNIDSNRTRFWACGGRALELLWVHVPRLDILSLSNTSLFLLGNIDMGIQLFDRCIERLNPPNSDRVAADHWMRSFLLELRDHATVMANAAGSRTDEKTMVLRRLQEDIVAHPERPWYFQAVAEELDWSYTHFYKRFAELAGMGPQDFLAQQRVELVKRLLRMSDLSIGEIADRCGFCNPFALSRFFKHRVGMSPSQYRQRPIDDLREARQ